MSTLTIIIIVISTLVFASLFDSIFTKIFRSNPPKDSIEHLGKLAEEIEPKSFKIRRIKRKWETAFKNLIIWK